MMYSSTPEENEYNTAVKRSLDLGITTHIRVIGLSRIHSSVLSKDLEAIKRCGSLRDVTIAMEQAIQKWKDMGIFQEVKYFFQPTEDGDANDICVQIEVVESRASKSISVLTSDCAYPEVNVGLENILGGRYSLKGTYIPSATRMHSITFSLLSNVPFLGTNAEYSVENHTEKKYYHLASAEKFFEIKALARNVKGGMSSEFTVGFQRRRLVPANRRDIIGDDLLDFKTTYKGYVRHDMTISRVQYHQNEYLYNMYPLPISGTVVQMANEIAGGVIGGDFSFFKSELQRSKFWSLGPFASVHWSVRLGGIMTNSNNRIPLNDRLFLSSSHIRGFKSIGPSTLDRLTTASRFAATGGNALWASSISLSFPFIGMPNNGFAAMHVFGNIGNLRMVNSFSQLTDFWKWIRESACSVGAGMIITRIPLLGVQPSGRFELNFSIPIGVTRNGDITFRNGPKELFERVKFGLVWSSQTSL